MHHYKLLACKLLNRELSLCAAESENYIDITWMRQELHSTPDALRAALQSEIDSIESGDDLHSADYRVNRGVRHKKLDAILFGYGLCSNAVAGLRSSSVPLVIPRCHDCTTLLMGSKERYREYFDAVKGTSFISRGWADHGFENDDRERDFEALRARYMEEYDDEDAVDFLMEMAENSMVHYSCLTCIFWNEFPRERLEEMGRRRAEENGWEFKAYEGSSSLLRDLLEGRWDEEKFLVVQPGQTVVPSYDRMIIKAESLWGCKKSLSLL